jgi:sigma-E factor negative regulatory protein RseA
LLVPPARPATRWRSIMPAAAVAAGFVAVGGAVLVLQAPNGAPAVRIAQVPAAPTFVAAAPAPPAAPPAQAQGEMIRDARLQQYLAAHKQFGGSTALGVPSQFLRSATVEVPAR